MLLQNKNTLQQEKHKVVRGKTKKKKQRMSHKCGCVAKQQKHQKKKTTVVI